MPQIVSERGGARLVLQNPLLLRDGQKWRFTICGIPVRINADNYDYGLHSLTFGEVGNAVVVKIKRVP